MSTKHTPGPWHSCIYPPESYRFPHVHIGQRKKYENECTEYMVVNSVSGEQTDGCFEANARLIAAAPDLLEALQGMMSADWPNLSLSEKAERGERARAAIAKATAP